MHNNEVTVVLVVVVVKKNVEWFVIDDGHLLYFLYCVLEE